jgi:lipid A 3-O-deacylase
VRPFVAATAALLAAAPAPAAELFGGVLKHAVDTPFTKNTGERGTDLQLGIRGGRIAGLGPIGGPAPYAFVSFNTAGETNLAAAGLAWRIGAGPLFVRPGIGIAIHDGPSRRVGRKGYRTDLGSRVLFEPELGIGFAAAPGVDLEANWTHVSHATLFGPQNPGMDMIGLRVNLRLP